MQTELNDWTPQIKQDMQEFIERSIVEREMERMTWPIYREFLRFRGDVRGKDEAFLREVCKVNGLDFVTYFRAAKRIEQECVGGYLDHFDVVWPPPDDPSIHNDCEWHAQIDNDMREAIDDARKLREIERQVIAIMNEAQTLYTKNYGATRSIQPILKKLCAARHIDIDKFRALWERQINEGVASKLHSFGVTWPPPDDLIL